MFPAVPTPDDGAVKTPVEFALKPGWRYDAKRGVFASQSKETVTPEGLPKGAQIVSQTPALADVDPRSLSEAERNLQRFMQLILPPGKSARDYVGRVVKWKCVAEAHVGPAVSLPDRPI